MSKSYVTVAQVAIFSSSKSGRRKFDNEIAMMAYDMGAEDWSQSALVTGGKAAQSKTELTKFKCYHSS
jgi:hypothetical protein